MVLLQSFHKEIYIHHCVLFKTVKYSLNLFNTPNLTTILK